MEGIHLKKILNIFVLTEKIVIKLFITSIKCKLSASFPFFGRCRQIKIIYDFKIKNNESIIFFQGGTIFEDLCLISNKH